MDGKTLRISSAHYSQAIELSSGEYLLVRSDNGPHRICPNREAAQKASGWVGDPQPWAASNPGKSDDAWSGIVSIKGDALATMRERSRVTYDEAEVHAAEAAQRVGLAAASDAANARRASDAAAEAEREADERIAAAERRAAAAAEERIAAAEQRAAAAEAAAERAIADAKAATAAG